MSEERRTKKSDTNKLNSKKRSGALDAILKLMAFVYVVITIIFYISVIKMNLLPGMYVTIFTVAEIVLTFAIVIGLVKKHKKATLNVICLIAILLISIVYVYVSNYAFATSNFLSNVFTKFSETEEYYIVVKSDSKYQKVEDIKGQEVYLFQIEDDIKTEIAGKASITFKSTNGLTEIGDQLVNSKIQAIVVSSAQYSMLSEEIKDFQKKTKIIYTVTHKIETKATIADQNSTAKVQNGVFNVYISGIDTAGKITNVSRSDANILATVNTKTHEILLTSIPRDYYVTLHSKRAKDKLTHSGIYGVNETVTTIEDLLGIDINYYVRVNFTTVIKLVDTLGGIDINSDYTFTAWDGTYFQKGYNHLDGAKALSFSRERESFVAGDNQRIKDQQIVIEAIINRVMDSKTILTKYTSILNSLEGTFQTNISQDEISSLVRDQLSNMSSWTIKTYSLTGTNATATTYSMGSQRLYVMIPNSSSVQEAKSKISQVMGK
ncbi:MAG: LCP family protein [Clostridia bacterium]|nr:LCP family protein [Clostridia bacterium]